MAHTVPLKTDVNGPDDSVFAAGQPITSAIGQWLQKQLSHLYEVVYDEAFPGNTAQTAVGHDHTGSGNGRAIPRHLASLIGAYPPYAAADSPDEHAYAYWRTAGVDVMPAPRVVLESKCVNNTDFMLMATARVRVRAGATHLLVIYHSGVDVDDGGSGNGFYWRVRLEDTAETEVDSAWESDVADTDATWRTLPRIGHACDTSGETGGLPLNWDAVNLVALPLAADADFVVRLGACPIDAPTGASEAYLYEVEIYEVVL